MKMDLECSVIIELFYILKYAWENIITCMNLSKEKENNTKDFFLESCNSQDYKELSPVIVFHTVEPLNTDLFSVDTATILMTNMPRTNVSLSLRNAVKM